MSQTLSHNRFFFLLSCETDTQSCLFFPLTFLPPVIATFCSLRWQNLAYVLTGKPVGWQRRKRLKKNKTKLQQFLNRPPCRLLKKFQTWLRKNINSSKSYILSYNCQLVCKRQAKVIGETCWLCFWHMGIRGGPTKLSGWGKIYCCRTKALDRILPTFSTLRWFISVHTKRAPKKMRNTEASCLLPAQLYGPNPSNQKTIMKQQCCFWGLEKLKWRDLCVERFLWT